MHPRATHRSFSRFAAVALSGLAASVLVVPAVHAAPCPTVAGDGTVSAPAPAPGVNWSGCDLSGAHLNLVDLSGANLAGSNLSGAQLWSTVLVGADLTGANLTSASVMGDLTNATLTNATLTDAVAHGATWTNVTSGGLIGTPYSLASSMLVYHGYLVGPTVNLTGADLTGLPFADGDLAGTRLGGADLTGATLTGVHSGSITGAPAALPSGWHVVKGYLAGPGAGLYYAALSGANLGGFDLTGANLSSATITGANLTGTNLTGAALQGVVSGSLVGTPSATPASWKVIAGFLVGPGAVLTDANLTGADLTGVSLAGAWLEPANLTRVNAAGVTFADAHTWNVTLVEANLAGANLAGIDLTAADLTDAVITGADIRNTSMGFTKLYGVVSGGLISDGTGRLPRGYLVVAGYLVGPGVKLVGADLTGADLTGADLSAADLTGADLTGATLTDVVWGGTICPDGKSSEYHSPRTCLGVLESTKPIASITAPAGRFVMSTTLTVTWTATDVGSGVASSQLRYFRVPTAAGGAGTWIYPAAWAGLKTRTATLAGVLGGYTYCVSVRPTDLAGNVGAWSATRCAPVPYDDRTLVSSSGWIKATARGWFASTYTSTTAAGRALTTRSRVYARSIVVIAWRCPTCGTLTAYLGSTKVGTVSLRATTSGRALVAFPALARKGYGVVRLVTGSARLTRIDALGYRP